MIDGSVSLKLAEPTPTAHQVFSVFSVHNIIIFYFSTVTQEHTHTHHSSHSFQLSHHQYPLAYLAGITNTLLHILLVSPIPSCISCWYHQYPLAYLAGITNTLLHILLVSPIPSCISCWYPNANIAMCSLAIFFKSWCLCSPLCKVRHESRF